MLKVDENTPLYAELDDDKFVATREAILLLLPKLFPEGSSKWSSLAVMEHFIDDTVGEIAYIWLSNKKGVRDDNGKY